jgi:hypothetical protein
MPLRHYSRLCGSLQLAPPITLSQLRRLRCCTLSYKATVPPCILHDRRHRLREIAIPFCALQTPLSGSMVLDLFPTARRICIDRLQQYNRADSWPAGSLALHFAEDSRFLELSFAKTQKVPLPFPLQVLASTENHSF